MGNEPSDLSCGLRVLEKLQSRGSEARGHTSEPMAPLPGVGMKAISAVRAVRTLQEGCQCSGWWLLMDRHT